MPGAMRCSPWSELPAKTTSMRRIWKRSPERRPIRRTDRLGKPQTGTLTPPGHRAIPAAGPPVARLVPPILAADLSAQLRDRLLGELSGLQSSDEAANWANRSLPAKNTLIVADAQLVEDGFRIKIAALGEAQPAEPAEAAQNPNPATAKTRESLPIGPGTGRGRIAAKTIRLRDKDHRKFVSSQPCLVCGRSPADAHHLRFAQPRALGRKVSDEFTVPVCRVHHRELHRHGDEAAWWQRIKIDPLPIARRLWQHARPNGTAVAVDGDTGSQVCNRAKSFGAALGCDDPGSRRRFGECSFHRYRSSHQPVTSFRQIEANRRNALRSTGPITEDGKRRSRQNAVRHGLSAETVVEIVEDIDDYRGFEAAIIADYDARTAVERELVLRLASLLWRLRRATMIETELLRIQAEVLRDRRSSHLAVRSRDTAIANS